MKIRTLIIALVAVAALAGAWLFFFTGDETVPEGGDESARSFFSFFGTSDDRTPIDNDGEENLPGAEDVPGTGGGFFASPLGKMWSEPVGGARFVSSENGEEVLRFIERATGNVFESSVASGETERLTNTTIPGIQEVYWIDDDELVVRYLRDSLDTIETFVATILPTDPASTSTDPVGSLGGFFLPTNITALSVNGASGDIFYLLDTPDGSEGFVTPGTSHTPTRVMTSPVREWIPEWQNSTTLLLTTKPSGGIEGFSYTLSTGSGRLTKTLSGSGLTVRPLYGLDTIIYSITARALETSLYESGEGTSRALSFVTLPEKCALGDTLSYCAASDSPPSGLPDSWYQGRAFFTDRIWSFLPETGESALVLDPTTFTSEPLDITSLVVNESGELFAFINKRDGALWLYHHETATLPTEDVSEEN